MTNNNNNNNNNNQSPMFGIGMGAVGSLAGGLLGMFGQGRRIRQQHSNQVRLMNQQFKNQQALNQQGHDLQFDMWQKTNYPAQMKMLQEAGLNPALMYGMSGGGGTTTGSQGGGSAAGGQAPLMDIGSILQASKLGAEVELLKAQAEKTKAETENVGADTVLKGAQLDKFNKEVEEIQSKINLNKELGLTEENKRKLNNSIAKLNNQKVLESINEVNLSAKDIEMMEKYGISKSSPELMKTLRYVAHETGISEQAILTGMGGLAVLNSLTTLLKISK